MDNEDPDLPTHLGSLIGEFVAHLRSHWRQLNKPTSREGPDRTRPQEPSSTLDIICTLGVVIDRPSSNFDIAYFNSITNGT